MQSGIRSILNKANRIGYKSARETGTKIFDARKEFKLKRAIKLMENQWRDKPTRSIKNDSNLASAKLSSRHRISDSAKGIKTIDRAGVRTKIWIDLN